MILESQLINTYAGSPLNRLNNKRQDDAFWDHLQQQQNRSFIFFTSDLRVLVYENKDPDRDATVSTNLVLFSSKLKDSDLSLNELFLGEWKDSFYLALRCNQPSTQLEMLIPYLTNYVLDSTLQQNNTTPSIHLFFSDLRRMAHKLSPENNAMLAHARALFEFQERHAFCGRCGSPCVSEQGGTRMRCKRNHKSHEGHDAVELAHNKNQHECVGMWFPRSDLAVIALVIDKDDRILLGRQSRWPQGMYSCLAGFLEHGESIEEAVRREVFEESGIVVGHVRYHSSQPWPFPYSIMTGCVAKAESTDIHVDEKELEKAAWFTREQAVELLKRCMDFTSTDDRVPPPTAIAHQLIKSFVNKSQLCSF